MLLGLTRDIADLHSSILCGEIHYAVLLGIEIGQTGLTTFDFDYAPISMQKEMYVNLVVQLSKLEAIIHGKQNAEQVLLLK